jgi:hypothetical protein
MDSRPSAFTRIIVRLRGEVPAATLGAYARASLLVHELGDEMEHRLLEHRAAAGSLGGPLNAAQQMCVDAAPATVRPQVAEKMGEGRLLIPKPGLIRLTRRCGD